jgi:hypothetical protein
VAVDQTELGADQSALTADLPRPTNPGMAVVAEPSDAVPLVDDGKRTMMMDAIDLAALGLDPASTMTGMMAAAKPEEIEDEPSGVVDNGSSSEGDAPAGKKKKRKRR